MNGNLKRMCRKSRTSREGELARMEEKEGRQWLKGDEKERDVDP